MASMTDGFVFIIRMKTAVIGYGCAGRRFHRNLISLAPELQLVGIALHYFIRIKLSHFPKFTF